MPARRGSIASKACSCISRSKRTRSASRSRAGGTISQSAGAGGTLSPNHRLRKRPSTAEVYPSPSPARRAGPTQTRVGRPEDGQLGACVVGPRTAAALRPSRRRTDTLLVRRLWRARSAARGPTPMVETADGGQSPCWRPLPRTRGSATTSLPRTHSASSRPHLLYPGIPEVRSSAGVIRRPADNAYLRSATLGPARFSPIRAPLS